MNNNPLLNVFDTPHGTAPFHLIKTEHFEPAILQAMEIHDKQVETIIQNPEEPTFANTIEALERSGALLDRVTTIGGHENMSMIRGEGGVWSECTFATPGFANNDAGYETYLASVGAFDYTVCISEAMADNGATVYDSAAGFADWVELYNYGSEAVSLKGCFLSHTADGKLFESRELKVIFNGILDAVLSRRREKKDIASDTCLSHFNTFENVSAAENVDVTVLFDGSCNFNSTASVAVALENRHNFVAFTDTLAYKFNIFLYLCEIHLKI